MIFLKQTVHDELILWYINKAMLTILLLFGGIIHFSMTTLLVQQKCSYYKVFPLFYLKWPSLTLHILLQSYVHQRCLNERPMVKFIVRTSAYVRVYPADVVLSTDRFLPSAPAVTNASVQVCVDSRLRGHGSAQTCVRIFMRTCMDTHRVDNGQHRCRDAG